MKSARILREKIDNRSRTLGMLVMEHLWLGFLEIARNVGLDYLIIDLEHSQFSWDLVGDVCAVGRQLDFPILIRPPETTCSYVRRAADCGACGLLLPQVAGVEMLDEVRRGLYLPPRGQRRPGGRGNRWVPDIQYETWVREVENDFIVLPQIENQAGLEQAEAIARHELTTAIAIGPYDLSASLGVCWDPTHPRHQEAVAQIRAAGAAAGKPMWMIGPGPALIEAGFTFICIGEPLGMLEAYLKQSIEDLRQQEADGNG